MDAIQHRQHVIKPHIPLTASARASHPFMLKPTSGAAGAVLELPPAISSGLQTSQVVQGFAHVFLWHGHNAVVLILGDKAHLLARRHQILTTLGTLGLGIAQEVLEDDRLCLVAVLRVVSQQVPKRSLQRSPRCCAAPLAAHRGIEAGHVPLPNGRTVCLHITQGWETAFTPFPDPIAVTFPRAQGGSSTASGDESPKVSAVAFFTSLVTGVGGLQSSAVKFYCVL